MNQITDAEFTQGWESPTKTSDPERYVRRCRRIRRRRAQRASTFIRRLLGGSLLVFGWVLVLVLALLVGWI